MGDKDKDDGEATQVWVSSRECHFAEYSMFFPYLGWLMAALNVCNANDFRLCNITRPNTNIIYV